MAQSRNTPFALAVKISPISNRVYEYFRLHLVSGYLHSQLIPVALTAHSRSRLF